MRPELFNSDEETNMFVVECKLFPSLVLYALTLLKIGGCLLIINFYFHYHFDHVFFFQANRLYGLIGFVTFSVSFLDSQLMLV